MVHVEVVQIETVQRGMFTMVHTGAAQMALGQGFADWVPGVLICGGQWDPVLDVRIREMLSRVEM